MLKRTTWERAKFLKVASFLVGLVIAFFCAEIIIRANPRLYCIGYRPSTNEKLIYELYPGYSIESLKAKISKQGLHDRYYSIAKPANVFRIAIVGDSTSFGWKVEMHNSFPKLLEKILNQKDGRAEFEVINFSVPGYNTAQEYELIKEKVTYFDPNIVILVYCGNDTHVCNYIKPDITFLNFIFHNSYACHFFLRNIDVLLSLKDSKLKAWWQNVIKKNMLGMFYYEQLIYPYPSLEETIYINDSPPALNKDTPKKYWYMLGYANYQQNLSNIAAFLRERNITFISSGFFNYPKEMIENLGVKYLCDFNEIRLRDGELREVVFQGNNGHPTIQGHRFVAEYIYNFLVNEHLI